MAVTNKGTLHPGEGVTVRKLNAAGEAVFSYPGVIAEVLVDGVRLDAAWTRDEMALDYVTFEPGDHFIEWFYTDRWYNIMEVRTPSGALKGWYCNIGHPAVFAAGIVTYRDLLLDLWVAPDGAALTLDEQEFVEDTSLTVDVRAKALEAMAQLRERLARREAPFDMLMRPGE